MEIFNPLDADKWRELVKEFDAKRQAFFAELNALRSMRGATPDLERRRTQLIAQAGPVNAGIDTLMNAMASIRNALASVGRFFGFGNASETTNQLGFAPLLIGIGLAAAAAIVASITAWLTKTAQFKAENEKAKLLVEAGATPAQLLKVKSGAVSSAKLFGFDVRWLLALGALALIGPYAVKWISKRR